MQILPILEDSPLLDRIEAALRDGGEVILTRGDVRIARVLPAAPEPVIRSRAALRATLPLLRTPSENLIREDRDAR